MVVAQPGGIPTAQGPDERPHISWVIFYFFERGIQGYRTVAKQAVLSMALHPWPGCDVLHVALAANDLVGVGIQCGGDQGGGAAGGRCGAVVLILIHVSGIRKILQQIFYEQPLTFCRRTAALQLFNPLPGANILHVSACATRFDVAALLNQPNHQSVQPLLVFRRILELDLTVDLLDLSDTPAPYFLRSIHLKRIGQSVQSALLFILLQMMQ